jgi:hypothetical protein
MASKALNQMIFDALEAIGPLQITAWSGLVKKPIDKILTP